MCFSSRRKNQNRGEKRFFHRRDNLERHLDHCRQIKMYVYMYMWPQHMCTPSYYQVTILYECGDSGGVKGVQSNICPLLFDELIFECCVLFQLIES